MITVFIVFLILLIIGVPVASTIGASGMMFLLQNTHFPLTHVVQLPLTQVQNISMPAILLLILTGNLMNNRGVTKRLVGLATLLTGHMRGGLAQTNVVLNTLMGGVSDSATANTAIEARLLDPDMIESGYSKGLLASVLTFTSSIVATTPPGVGLIIYGTARSVSIGKLFSVGIFMGLYTMIVLVVSVVVITRMRGYKPVRRERATLRKIDINLEETIWAAMFPMTLLVGVRMGFFSPSEVGAFACFYSVFVGAFIYRELAVQSFLEASKDSIGNIGSIMMTISLTTLFGYGILIDKIPQKMTAFITGITANPALVPVLTIILLVFVGVLMEGSVVILLLTPIFPPMCQSAGTDPTHLGFLMCMIATIGVNTPSVGTNMYTVNTILNRPLQEYTRSMIPFLAATLLAIGLLAFFPDMALFLP